MQVLVTGVVLFVLQWFFMISVVLSSLAGLLTILGFALWLVMVYKAWLGDMWEVPVLGGLTRLVLKKLKM